MKSAQHGKGLRYKVRYLNPDTGREQSKSFPDKCKKQAEDFLLSVQSEQRNGRFVDPNAGAVLLRDYVENWIKGQAANPSSRDTIRKKVDSRILTFLGAKPLHVVERPGVIRDWLDWLRSLESVSENYVADLFDLLSSILSAAVAERIIHSNPCKSHAIKRPKRVHVAAVAWEPDRITTVRAALDGRESIAVDVAVGLGLRLGEIFGLSPDDVDEKSGLVHVRRQIKLVRGVHVFALPKRDKIRTVPLSPTLAATLRAHLSRHPAREVTLPWRVPGGRSCTVSLVMPRPGAAVWDSAAWSARWTRAFRVAGLNRRARIDGIHGLRHTFASVMLANGVSVRELAEYLGHANPATTLRIYTHMLPSSHQRAQHAMTTYLDTYIRPDAPADGLYAA